MDIDQKPKQPFWENPRNVALFVGIVAAAVAVLFYSVGYKIASTPPAPIVIQLVLPTAPAPTPAVKAP